jgi:hypothetical protein
MTTKTIKRLSEEDKKTIETMFAEGHSAEVIGKAIWRSPQTIRNYLDSSGLKPIVRRNGSKSKSKAVSKCPHCGKTGQPKGARFCYNCGKDIRSEATILTERTRKILQVIAFLPDNMRSETSDTIQDVIRYLEKQD